MSNFVKNVNNVCQEFMHCSRLYCARSTAHAHAHPAACCATAINAMHTNSGHGNPELANLPRKLNIGLSNSRDDFPHTHINDVGLKAVEHPETGEVSLGWQGSACKAARMACAAHAGGCRLQSSGSPPACHYMQLC